jgi:NAD(P)-dependent dehydrogenase (short-subunit alcohol dehydrogenase family)
MRRFIGKIVVITGGTSRIGLTAARHFVKEDVQIVVTGWNSRSIAAA